MTGPTARTPTQEALAAALAEEEVRLRRLEADHAEAKARVAALRAEMAATVGPTASDTAPAPRSPAEKVRLFRQLFRGRDDVYPVRFVSKKTSKAGYAPDCANKFVAGVCELPKVKCGDCTKQAFRTVDDTAILRHLTGKHVMGVYPMLRDETCWLLAVDFDKSTWKEDVRAFLDTAQRYDLPALVERSRSGNGAHVWFFFSAPVSAASARRMGCHLLTEAMATRPELSMESYDRLFPSQDTMPRGGFGNLIALPLQHLPRRQGNSVFLDETLSPYPDDRQWSVMAAAARIDPARVEAIAADATRTGTVIGTSLTGGSDDKAELPWTRPPSGKRPAPRVVGPVPSKVMGVLAQQVFIEKAELPSSIVNQLARVAAFQNPEFYKKQSLRLSTARTPRVIACAQDQGRYLALPRGCVEGVRAVFAEHQIALDLGDERATGEPLRVAFRGTLTAWQKKAAAALLAHDIGVLVAPPGVGKTVIGAYLVAVRACSTLILVHRKPLLEQWIARLSIFLGVERKEIGRIGGAKRAPNGRLDVATFQSLVRKESVSDLVAGYGQVIVDECHHVPAVQFERVLREVKARYLVGLTATPQRRDGHHPISTSSRGP